MNRFFVLLVVYLVAGILILRFGRGARGVEQIPNVDFWKELPLLVKVRLIFHLRDSSINVDKHPKN
jgi:hypothetical protein